LHAAFDLLDSGECKPATNASACRYRRNKPHAIQAVVDSHPHAGNGYCMSREHAQQRQRQKAVRDRGLVGRVTRSTLGIEVDPLAVFSSLGELIDPFLRNFQPITDAGFPARLAREGSDGFNLSYWHCSVP